MKKFFYSTAIILSLFLTSSCEKDETEDPTTDPTGKSYELDFKANALIQAETTANEMEFTLKDVLNECQFPNAGTYLGVGTIRRQATVDGLVNITVDFGAGALCSDGKFRSGRLTIETSESNLDNAIMTLQDFKVDKFQVYGFYVISGLLHENLAHFIANGAIAKNGSNFIEFNLDREVKQVEGASTTDISDNVFERSYSSFKLQVTDNDKTTDMEVSPITTTAVSKLKYSCSNMYFPVTGKFKVKSAPIPGTNPNSSLSDIFYFTFGDGNCGDKPYTQKSL